MTDPGRHLRLHRAPRGLVPRAMRPSAPAWRGWALAAMFLVGLASGAIARGPAVPAPVGELRVATHLELRAPDAGRVEVAGTWNDWRAEPMQAASAGRFHLLKSLPRGRYEYMFLVDGREWIADPSAPVSRDDGFGRRNSVLEI